MEHLLVDGECVSCSRSQPVEIADPAHHHVLDNGICTTCDGDDQLDEDSAALLQALNEMDGPLGDAQRAAWDPAKHVRNPKGPGGGRFRSNVDKLKDAIAAHKAGTHDGHPFDGFNREQLRKVAKARGIDLKRGEDRDSIAAKLLDHLGGNTPTVTTPKAVIPPEKPSLNPAEVGGRDSQWWTQLREDTGMNPVPIRNLELGGGYVIKSGKAYRIDGVTILVEDGVHLPPDRVAREFHQVHKGLPEADTYQHGYAWLAGRNPADSYWAQQYGMPGFTSAATAGDGAVRMWDRRNSPLGPNSYRDELMHEFGHNVSTAAAGRGLHDAGRTWESASRADKPKRPIGFKATGPLGIRALDLNYQEQHGKRWPQGVSTYGTASPGGGLRGVGRVLPGRPDRNGTPDPARTAGTDLLPGPVSQPCRGARSVVSADR